MELLLEDLEQYSRVILRGRAATDDEFLEFCTRHEDLRVESNAAGEVELMPGTGPDTGRRNLKIAMQIGLWTEQDGSGVAFDSSTLFVLPSGARRSPDASWIARSRIDALPEDQRGHLWRISPDFIIELMSPSDRLPDVREKMAEWITNGVQLAWLLDPATRTVEIHRPGEAPEVLTGIDAVKGTGPVDGFVLKLESIWA